jgi:hypothetical protein
LRSGLEWRMTTGEITEGAFCRTTGTLKHAYRVLGDALICYTHLESS